MTTEEAIDCFKHPTKHWSAEREEADKMAVQALNCVNEIIALSLYDEDAELLRRKLKKYGFLKVVDGFYEVSE